MKTFKAEQCVAKLARSRACDRLHPLQQSVSSSGFQRGIMTPAETLKWNPPSCEAGTSAHRLYVFVEGADDQRFFHWYFDQQYKVIIPYAQMKKEKVNALMKGIQKIPETDYILLADADNQSVADKIEKIKTRFSACEREKIYIVKREIESWYLAGLKASDCKKWHIHYYSHTNDLVKEDFDRLKPKHMSRIHFMLEILKRFDLSEGVERNGTFYHFCQKNRR